MSNSRPVAIIGHACRFPGNIDTPSRFWDVLLNGCDVVSEIPDDRWEKRHFLHEGGDEAGKTYTFKAGTLGDVSGFDAAFFGISPREAEQIDPQQRLLLEMTWEALERGGQIPDHLAGTDCAVYVGISGTDYADIRQGDPSGTNAYFMLGSVLSIAANRISYVFDLHGPSMAVDTACSSSMVAMNEAFHAVSSGRAGMAVVGGVNLLLSPFPFIGFSQASMLSPYGRCRAFDKIAKGYVRAEGGGVLVLKPLAEAQRDGDPILAVIKGTGVNTDGRTQGIALPSSERQEELLRRVYDQFGADPDDLVYFETHGTGTSVGDPAETGAVGRALAQRRSSPLPIGSAKSNLGHMEPASGMAGLIKAVEVLRRGVIPPTLHVQEPNPEIDFDGLNLRIATKALPVPARQRPGLVGVNSFGFGGANAHVLLEEYRAPAPAAAAAAEPEQPVPVVLSARSPEALKQAAARLADALAGDEAPAFHDVAWTLAQRRAHHNHRLLLRTTSTEALLPQLRAAADGEPPATAAKGRIVSPAPKVAFVYSGNGAQWLGMGVQLLAEDSAFRAEVGRIDALVKAQAGWSVIDELHAAPEASRIADTRFSQPLLFAVQAGITASLAARGLSPEAVTGHSVGEVAAAYAAGALNLETAVHVILSRSAAQGKTRGMGRMAAVSIDAERAAAEIAALDGAVEVAAINSPGAVTLSGSEQALLALKEKLAGENIDVRMLDLDYAFHNRVLEPFRDDLIKSLGKLAPAAGTARFYSTVTGARIDGTALDATYWWDNVRQPVRFRQAVQALAADGFDILLEISPHPIIQSYVRQTLRGTSSNGQLVPLVNRQNAGANRLASAVDQAWTLGAKLNWNAIFPQAGTCVDLPTYPWQRERFWFPVTPEARGPMFSRWEGTLLGWRPAPGVPMWETTLDATILPFLADHQVGGAVVFPAAGFIEMTLEASRALFDGDLHDIEQMEIRRPLVLDRCKVVRFSWTPEPGTFQIASRTRMSDEPWSVHVTGRLVKAAHESAPQAPAFVAGKDARQVAPAEHYAFAESIGLVYGPVFQTVGGVTVDGSVALARLKSAGIEHAEQFEMHPALFDGCLQALFNILKDRMQSGDRPHAFLPSQFGRLLIHGDAASAVACRVELKRVSLRSIVADFLLTDADGAVVVEARACRFQRMELGGGAQAPARYGFEVVPLTPHTATAALPPPAPVGKQDADMAELNAVAAAFAAEALAALGKHPVAMGREALAQQVRTLAALPPAGTTADALWRATLAKRPDCLSELTMLGRVGLRLADLLSGADAGAALPAASTVDHFLDASPARAVAHDAVAEAVAAFVATWPSHRRLRVLEVGGGSTGLTRRLLNLLPADGNSYTVAILDPDFVQVAEASLAGRPNRSVVLLDPAAPLAEQPALQAGQYDVVVAADSLGGWADPAEAFRAIAALGGAGAAVIACAPRPTGWLELIAAAYDAAGRAFAARPVADMTAAATQAGLTEVRAAGTVVTAAVATATAETAATATDGLWLILCSPDGAEADLANDLAERLGTALLVHPADSGAADDAITVDAASADSWLDLLATMKEADSEPAGIVHLLGTAGAEGSESQRCLTLLALAQGLPDAQLSTPPRLVVVTAGALDAPGGTVVPSQAPLWGLGRVLRNEFPQFNVRLIDLHGPVAALGEPLAAEIAAPDDEDEVILAADRRLGLRLKRVADHAAHSGEAETLHFASGSLDYLSWVPAQRREPAHGEVEIAVKATGLNFRDVMLALGILPDEAVENGFAGATVGMEAAGVVTRVGPGVGNLAVGDSVLFFAPACFSSYVTTRTTAVGRLPAGMGFAEAATIPTTFFTVYYALNELARLRAGERVLIHGAAGGVGLAAIQYCRHVGAEIYATAGTPEKRDIVRLAGVPEDRILDSRTLAFADQIRALTNGEGVDVVVNSLAGEAIHKSLATLRPFGRFLELGKRDFFANSPLGLRPFRNNISYFGIDADQLMAVKPDLAGTLFAEMMQLFEQGAFRPLPYRTFTRDRIVEAFRHMQQSRHIGKIVVAAPEAAAATSAPTSKDGTLRLDPAGSYVVTGGLGGFGLATAQWLAAKGARTLVLASRRGAATEEARDAVAALEKQGVTVLARACDVTDPAQVRALVAEAAAVAPVKGVVHAAAVFDDGIATNMTAEQFERVVAPKLIGGWALHEATAGMALDFFVAYSSVTTILGNPGQANYVAGNMYLEALAQYRRAQGLPALAIGWGAIADAGYLTRNTEVRDSLSKRMGVDALTTDSALAQLERLIVDGGPAVTVVADVNWRTLGAGVPALKSPRFAEVAAGGRSEAAGEALDLNKLLADLSPTEVREVLIELVAEQVGSVLRIPADRLDLDMSVFDMGMDSLMAMELRMAIEERFGVELPAMAISEGASITRLAERIRDHLQGGAKAPQEDSAVHAVLAQHAESVDAAAIRDEMERLSANEEEDTSVS